MKFILVILFSVISVSLSERRIFGAFPVEFSFAPYHVGLIYRGDVICGGALLSKVHVLTAAHCVTPFRPRKVTVSVGSNSVDKNKNATHIRSLKFYVHPNYDVNNHWDHDFAIIKLKNIRDFPTHVEFIKLPSDNDVLKTGDMMIITGFGRTESGRPEVLMGAMMPIYDKEKCGRLLVGKRLSANMFCAGYDDREISSCDGDSGSSLRRESDGKVFGVVSWGRQKCDTLVPSVYANVQKVTGWINSIAFPSH
jgi:trypsin